MATYESLITINGAVGDLVFYNLNGKNIVRKKSGFNKTAFKKSPSYEKVRQNSSEFGHCSKVGKKIRQCINPFIKEADDALLYQKFAKLMTEIKDLDTVSERGKRTVKNGMVTENGKELLRNFQFGNIANMENKALISFGLWDGSLALDKDIIADEIQILTIKVDFERYETEYFEEQITIQKAQREFTFEKHFSDEDMILHFVALKKEKKIVQMGFV